MTCVLSPPRSKLLKLIYNCSRNILQLLLGGGSIQIMTSPTAPTLIIELFPFGTDEDDDDEEDIA